MDGLQRARGRPRVYCLMVSRLGLGLDEKRQAVRHRRQLANLEYSPGLLREQVEKKTRRKPVGDEEATD